MGLADLLEPRRSAPLDAAILDQHLRVGQAVEQRVENWIMRRQPGRRLRAAVVALSLLRRIRQRELGRRVEHDLRQLVDSALRRRVVAVDAGDPSVLVLDAHRAERAGRKDIDNMPMHRRLARLVHQHVEAVAGAPQNASISVTSVPGTMRSAASLHSPRGGTRCNTASGVAMTSGGAPIRPQAAAAPTCAAP